MRRLQDEVFVAQAELARAPGSARTGPTLEARHVQRLEHEIDTFDARHPPLTSFVIPGGSPAGAMLQFARALSRRAERELVSLNALEPLDPVLLAWANRLSDLLFALALAANHASGVPEAAPRYDA